MHYVKISFITKNLDGKIDFKINRNIFKIDVFGTCFYSLKL